MDTRVDIKENKIRELDKRLLALLLKDHTTGENIIWATDNYESRGRGYYSYEHIEVPEITGRNGNVIKPRTTKSKQEQLHRVKDKAEVFTPSWICNKMANALDEEWFGRKDVFNIEQDKTWQTVKDKIVFPEGKTWQDYVNRRCLEITCGEVPFLVSRYDTTTGDWIEVNDRIGVLDRKLRVINENVDSEPEWVSWVFKAFKVTYGYEWQGDSLLIARENLLYTFIDYYEYKFEVYPLKSYLIDLAKIVSWNIFQMDGLKYVIPNSCKPVPKEATLFDLLNDSQNEQEIQCEGCKTGKNDKHIGIYPKIMNWSTKHTSTFYKGAKKMKFDFVIGNPPYQMEDKGKNSDNAVERTSAIAVYPFFVSATKHIATTVSLIIPSRWMTGGKGLDKFRNENINDCRFKLIHDYEDDKALFPNTDIGGGIMYYVWNKNYNGEIDYYFHNHQGVSHTKRYLNTGNSVIIRDYSSSLIVNKIDHTNSFMNIVSARNPFSIDAKTEKDEKNYSKELTNNYCKYYCWDGTPTVKYIKKNIITDKELLNNYKVFISKTADPPIRFGRENNLILRKPFLGVPNESCSETYLTIGNYKSELEPNNIIKYIKTKFLRFLVLQKKKTQNVSRGVFEFVPLQDFTNKSDINWSKSIHEIDLQLYKKYGLDENEITFIETHVQEMK